LFGKPNVVCKRAIVQIVFSPFFIKVSPQELGSIIREAQELDAYSVTSFAGRTLH